MAAKKVGRPPKPPLQGPKIPPKEAAKRGGLKGGNMRSSYRPEFAAIAQTMCRMGAIDNDLAEAFGVRTQTLIEWRRKHPEFAEACAIGKGAADDMVERALFHRAIGYEHPAEKIFNHNGTIVRAEYVERYAPDTGAACFWLKNRRREQWKDRWDVELTDNTPMSEMLRKARERREKMGNGSS